VHRPGSVHKFGGVCSTLGLGLLLALRGHALVKIGILLSV
jgi:hypothetical protein